MDRKSARRPLFWEASAKRDFKQFPTAVQKDMGVALFVVQLGGAPPSAQTLERSRPGCLRVGRRSPRRRLSRCLYGEDREQHPCAPRLPEEIEVRDQDPQNGYRSDRAEAEGSLGALSQQRKEVITWLTRRRIAARTTSSLTLDFRDAEELTAKAILAKKINDIVESRGLTQSDAAKLLGMAQPKVSAIRNYKLRGISLERLMQALTSLGQHVEIVVSPCGQDTPARIDVAA